MLQIDRLSLNDFIIIAESKLLNSGTVEPNSG